MIFKYYQINEKEFESIEFCHLILSKQFNLINELRLLEPIKQIFKNCFFTRSRSLDRLDKLNPLLFSGHYAKIFNSLSIIEPVNILDWVLNVTNLSLYYLDNHNFIQTFECLVSALLYV